MCIVTNGATHLQLSPKQTLTLAALPKLQRQHACVMHLSSDNKIHTRLSVSQRHVTDLKIQGVVQCCRTKSRNLIKECTSICLYVSACQSVRLQAGKPRERSKIERIHEWDEEKRDKNYSGKQVYSWSPTAAFLYLDQWCFLVCNQDWGRGSAVWGVADNNTQTVQTQDFTVHERVVCIPHVPLCKKQKKKKSCIYLWKKILTHNAGQCAVGKQKGSELRDRGSSKVTGVCVRVCGCVREGGC